MGNTQSQDRPQEKPEPRRREPKQTKTIQATPISTAPVEVPATAQAIRLKGPPQQDQQDLYFVQPVNMNFPHPPRLPLPIQDQLHTPGSPVISPEDLTHALREDSIIMPQRASSLSHTTMDDEEEIDMIDQTNKGMTVPTIIEWKQPGNKVYITGTFTGWSKKYRMLRDPDTGILYAALELPPGTHHVKFIVDGDMQLSKDLPTAVDFANVLVNYIEVSADDIPRKETEQVAPEGIHPPMVIPPSVTATDFEHTEMRPGREGDSKVIDTRGKKYGQVIPQYLVDLDQKPQTHRFQRAENHLADIPAPPTLPLFLNKSILNGAMPMRDDISVLNMPNHTVLNHVATSSIKNDVLATSMTTRYKAKVSPFHFFE